MTPPTLAVPQAGTAALDAPAPARQVSLDLSLVRGIAWTGGVKWASQLLTWASTLVVARILTPEDYGIVGMATVFVGLVTMVSEFGLGAAVVVLRGLDPGQVRQINALSVLLGVASAALVCAAAVPLSRFTGTPELVGVLLVMSLGFVVAGFRTVPDAVLQKELAFRTLALMEGVGAIVMALVTVLLALAGAGYWTLVGGTLFGGLLSAGMAVARRPHGFARPRLSAVRQAVTFSGQLLVARLSWYLYSNADFMVVGKALGERALGAYTLAWSLASIPIGKVSATILRVTSAFFAAVQDDRAALRRYLLTITEGVALVTFPMTLGLALVADDLVLLALGEKWRGAILPLRLLALYASIRSVTPLLPQVLTAVGDVRFTMRNNVTAALLLPLAFVLGTRWGTTGVAAAWMLAHPLVLAPLFARVFRRLELSPAAYLRALGPAASGCALLGACVWAAARLAPAAWPLWALFAAQVAAGAAGYALAVLALHRDRLRAFRGALREARGSA
ncbi:MAG TPA: lipopolysaccharide biosynthesis protein [Longimicrobium sp.]|jgi:PST family polysaccharide transporter